MNAFAITVMLLLIIFMMLMAYGCVVTGVWPLASVPVAISVFALVVIRDLSKKEASTVL